ncbi:MAG: PLP-dependent aminotransferase family protein [Caldilineaceae bacterium]
MLTCQLQLERESHIALYQQIVDQLIERIRSNQLPAGARLPTIRQLAQELGVTRVTVQNAYDGLQDEGWIEATVGRGTFVSRHPPLQRTAPPVTATWGRLMTADAVIADLLQIHQLQGEQQGMIPSLALASPDPRLFPVETLWEAMGTLEEDGRALLCYGSPQGDIRLRFALAESLARRQINVGPEEIIVTNGLTQGLALVTQALTRPGDRVLVEQPTYLGFLNLLRAYHLEPLGVPLDEEGPSLEVLERMAVQYRPRFFYTIPTYQNPTGLCISQERRQALIEWAERHGIVLIEDDIYGRLSYNGAPPPPIKSMDRRDAVIYLTSESKVFFPGLRVGTIVAPKPLHERLLSLRRATDLCGSQLMQRLLANFLENKGEQQYLRKVLPIYRRRRDTMLAALRQSMPEGVTWTKPAGGFCIWLTMPNVPALHDIQQAALRHGMAIAVGDVFLTEPAEHKHIRLAFSYENEETIYRCVRILGRLIAERLGHAPQQFLANEWTPMV